MLPKLSHNIYKKTERKLKHKNKNKTQTRRRKNKIEHKLVLLKTMGIQQEKRRNEIKLINRKNRIKIQPNFSTLIDIKKSTQQPHRNVTHQHNKIN